MHNCKTCGASLIAVRQTGQAGYLCPYCGNGYSNSGITIPSAQATNMMDGADLFDKCIPGVLEIFWEVENCGWCSGSGYIIDDNGLAITNAHVVLDHDGEVCKTVGVRVCNKFTRANVVRCGDYRPNNPQGVDLALIRLEKIPATAVPLKFENFDNVRNGEQVYVIGNPKGEGVSITSGIVSDRLRNVGGKNLLMTDCTVNPGNSGGPIFNKKGLVIGTIVSKRTDADNMNYAIPSSTVISFLSS